MSPPTDSVSSLCFSPKANFLIATSWDNQVRCWEVSKNGTAIILHFLICSNCKTRYWDLRQQTPMHTQQIPERCCTLSVRHPLMVVGTTDKNLIVFNLQNPQSDLYLHLVTLLSKCFSSGKCQIIHRRQGHKDECHPFVNIHNKDEVDDSFGPKVVKQDVNDNYTDNYETEGFQRAKPAEKYSENPVLSRSSNLESLQKDDGGGNEYPPSGKAGDYTFKSTLRSPYEGSSASSVCSDSSFDASVSTSSGSDSSGDYFSAGVHPDEIGTATFSDRPILVNSADGFTGSGNQTKTYFHGHTHHRKLHSPGLDGSSEPEPSTSAGFWEGTIHSIRSRSDMPADAGRFSFSKAADYRE